MLSDHDLEFHLGKGYQGDYIVENRALKQLAFFIQHVFSLLHCDNFFHFFFRSYSNTINHLRIYSCSCFVTSRLRDCSQLIRFIVYFSKFLTPHSQSFLPSPQTIPIPLLTTKNTLTNYTPQQFRTGESHVNLSSLLGFSKFIRF